MVHGLLDLPNELLLRVAELLFVPDALYYTSTCKSLRRLGLSSTALWHAVLQRLPIPLPQGLALHAASAEQLRAVAGAAAAAHRRWSSFSHAVQPQKHLQLTSGTPGDLAVFILFKIIRSARWAVTCTVSGRVVVWDLRDGTPVVRHQLPCTPYTLEARTTMLDEDEDAQGAVLGVHYAINGKRYLVVLRMDFTGTEPTLVQAAVKEISNASILFSLAVSGSGHRVAGARMHAQTHLVDVLVWDYEASVDIRLSTDCVYLVHLSTLHMRITKDMLLLYGTTGSNTFTMSAVELTPSALRTIKERKEERHVHKCYINPYQISGVPGYKSMPMSVDGDTLTLFLRTPNGASFTHHRFRLSLLQEPCESAGDMLSSELVRPYAFLLERATVAGDARLPGSHAASPLLGAAGKRALWVSGRKLFCSNLGRGPENRAATTELPPHELALPPHVVLVIPRAEQIAYDEAWSAVGIASEHGRAWVLWY